MKPISPERVQIQGVAISAINLESSIPLILDAVELKLSGYICVTNVHGIGIANEDNDFRNILNNSFLTTPDGMPTVWLGKLRGHKNMGRVYGPDLLHEVCRVSPPYMRHYFYGGNTGIAEKLCQCLSDRFPKLSIAGFFTPPFRPLNEQEWFDFNNSLNTSEADIVWVGLSTPKQEKFMAEAIQRISRPALFIGIGAAFDFHSGHKKQAPKWLQKMGMEWAFRLATEPRRLFKRYAFYNSIFVIRLLRDWIFQKN